jgi:hypothetical protein
MACETMAISRLLPAAFGTLAMLATTAILALHIILAGSILDSTSPVRISAGIAATLEALALLSLCWFMFCHFHSLAAGERIWKFGGGLFGATLLFYAVAAAVSVAVVVCLSTAVSTLPNRILGLTATGFLVDSSVALGLAFAMQLMFLVAHFVLGRVHSADRRHSLHTEEDGNRSPQNRVKSIPYHETSPKAKKSSSASTESRTPPGSSGGRSATETISSIQSSLSHVVRPISSKTRLLSGSQRSIRKPPSLDSNALRSRPGSTEDGFDSWDTSAVDPQNRQTVLETSSPALGRFLETIPASPTTSRSPSPGTPLDLEPPRMRRRSRSYSPGLNRARMAERAAFTQQATMSESHIHPLFRSDSPTPPPIITPGTMVIAAPNAGQVISDRNSIRTLNRMRSASSPAQPSPLSHQSSFESFHQRQQSNSPELRDEMDAFPETERKMTPPIPDWILSAGARSSLTGYNSRKLRIDPNEEPAQI